MIIQTILVLVVVFVVIFVTAAVVFTSPNHQAEQRMKEYREMTAPSKPYYGDPLDRM